MVRIGATRDLEYLEYTCPPNMVARQDGANHVLTGDKKAAEDWLRIPSDSIRVFALTLCVISMRAVHILLTYWVS